jgi:hypothetical protein
MNTLNDPNSAPSIEFAVDPDHAGVRTVGCFTFAFGTIGSFLILNSLITNGGLLVAGASIAIAVALTYIADNVTKHYWPSNRFVQVIDDVIQLAQNDIAETQLNTSETINFLSWHFEASRHPRVPRGWFVVANALEQDGEYIITYTIASPQDLESLPLSRLSTKYERKKNKKDEARDLRKAGNIRRIEQAEAFRGNVGAEMNLEEYREYLDYLVETYPTWMPKDK